MSTKKKTKTQTVNSLPDWQTSPFQASLASAQAASQQPAISASTQGAIDRTMGLGQSLTDQGNEVAGTLSNMAQGRFGLNANALVDAAQGGGFNSNPFVSDGSPTSFGLNGGLNTEYIDNSGLNRTAAGEYLTADSNPYIRGVAQRGADMAGAAINSQFGGAGRSNGSGLYAQLFGQGVADASNNVYAQNYANERQLQQGAQNTLLGAEGSARESALGRQMSAQEAAAGRRFNAYDAERARQLQASQGLISNQLQAAGQLPSIFSSILGANTAALNAGQYQDQAALNQAGRYQGILSGIAAPYGISNSTQTQTTGGLGSVLGSIAQLGGAASSLFGGGGFFSNPLQGTISNGGPPAIPYSVRGN